MFASRNQNVLDTGFSLSRFMIRWLLGSIPICLLFGIAVYDGFDLRGEPASAYITALLWLLLPGFLIAVLTNWYRLFPTPVRPKLMIMTIISTCAAALGLGWYWFAQCEELGCLAVVLYFTPLLILVSCTVIFIVAKDMGSPVLKIVSFLKQTPLAALLVVLCAAGIIAYVTMA